MRTANRIEGCINAGSPIAPFRERAHNRNEVASAIVDRCCAEALDGRDVAARAGADRLEAEMARQIEERRSDRAGGADYEDRCSARKRAVTGEHLEGGEIR